MKVTGVILTILFITGLIYLFEIRFEKGDVYPPYSTLRSDPLGARAYYESLSSLPSLKVEPCFQNNWDSLQSESQATIFLLGADVARFYEIDRSEIQLLENPIRNGCRVILAFLPVDEKPPSVSMHENFLKEEGENESKKKLKNEESVMEGSPSENGVPTKIHVPLKNSHHSSKKEKNRRKKREDEPGFFMKRWQIQFCYGNSTNTTSQVTAAELATTTFPESARVKKQALPWHSNLTFENLGAEWTSLAQGPSGQSVMAMRSIGKGSLILISDPYFFSNEALRHDRRADLLAWMVGAHSHVVFDETHHGILQQKNMASLLRKYRLHGVIGAMLLLALLFIWKNASSLAPPPIDRSHTSAMVLRGQNHETGLIHLLRRNISGSQLMRVCFEEWKKSMHRRTRLTASDLAKIETELTVADQHPVLTYQAISKIIKLRHSHRK